LTVSTIREFDELKYGPCVTVIAQCPVYRRDKNIEDQVSSKSWDLLEPKLTKLVEPFNDLHRAANLVLYYEGVTCGAEAVFDTFVTLLQKCDVLLTVGETDTGSIIIFVKHLSYRKFPSLSLEDASGSHIEPQIFKLSVHRQRNDHVIEHLLDLQSCMRRVVSNMIIQKPYAVHTFEQFMHHARQLSSKELATLKGQCEMVSWKKRSEFQNAFLRVYMTLCRVLELESKCDLLAFSAWDPPMSIIPLSELRNLAAQLGSRLKIGGGGHESYSLLDLVREPKLLSRYGLLILGSVGTSGWGKSQFAKRLACLWSIAMCEALGLPRSRARIVITNTIDAARFVEFQPGMVWVLDEFEAGDRESVIYCSANIIKSIGNPSESCSIRGRNNDIVLPPNCARIITGNADSVDDWSGTRFVFNEPCQRKFITFQLKHNLCSDAWQNAKPTEGEEDSAHASVLETAKTRLLAELKEAEAVCASTKQPVTKKQSFWSMFKL
jgi:hypothetical protein